MSRRNLFGPFHSLRDRYCRAAQVSIPGGAGTITRRAIIKSCYAVGPLIFALTVTSCSSTTHDAAPAPQTVEAAALDSLLLSATDVDAVMGSNGMTPQPATSDLTDDRSVVTNLSCLGIWQTDEAKVYEKSGHITLRRQVLRVPNTDQWEDLVVQSVVSFPSAIAASGFFADSSGRWSQCVNHR
jgi:hypothetical protein